jgi:hypothetical protein
MVGIVDGETGFARLPTVKLVVVVAGRVVAGANLVLDSQCVEKLLELFQR